MDILIKGMEMPKSCWDCHFQDCGNCVVNAHKAVDKYILEDHRDDDCPLVPVPPHGRLGDLDKLSKRIKEEGRNQAEFYADRQNLVVLAYGDCYGKVNEAPTIIPASEEGDNG